MNIVAGTLQFSGSASIGLGAASTGALRLGNGVSMNAPAATLSVGRLGHGTFEMRDGATGALAHLSVGGAGTKPTATFPPTGVVTITGPGSSITTRTAHVGGWDAVGSVSVLDGARWIGTDTVRIGAEIGSRGSLLVSGTGSQFQVNAPLDAGSLGTASITVLNGGRIAGGLSNSGGAADILLSGRDSAWSTTGQFTLGTGGGDASLTVRDGATLTARDVLVGAQSAPLPGRAATTRIEVAGLGSSVLASDRITLGTYGGTSLLISDGGTVTAARLDLAGPPGPAGPTISVTGPGSSLAFAALPSMSAADLEVTGGATFTTPGATLGTAYGQPAVEVLISGRGSTWNSTGHLAVGQAGAATVRVRDGASLTTRTLAIGVPNVDAPPDAIHHLVWVSGAGSRLVATSTNLLTVNSSTSMGELRVADNAEFLSHGPIHIGPSARLTLDGDATVATHNGKSVHNYGLVTQTRGTLGGGQVINAGEWQLGSPSAAIHAATFANQGLMLGTGRVIADLVANPGEMRVTRDDRLVFTAYAPDIARNSGRINLIDGGTVEFHGDLNSDGYITFSGGGTYASTVPGGTQPATITNTGEIVFSGGASHVFAGLTNAGLSRTILTGQSLATFHGPVNHTAGEFRISEGATAVFIAPVKGSAAFTGTGAKFFEGGTSDITALTGGGDTTVQAPASLTVAQFGEDELTVRGTLQVSPAQSPLMNVVNTLTIVGDGVVDLANTGLLIRGAEAGQVQVLAKTEQYISRARNASLERWQGPGLTSSAAAADPLTTLAVGLLGDDVLVEYTYNGDANLDGLINADDYFRIDQGFLAQPSDPLFSQGDFNYDGRVNADDYFLIDQAFLGQGAPMVGSGASSQLFSVAVPEPAAALTLALFTALSLARRHRRAPA